MWYYDKFGCTNEKKAIFESIETTQKLLKESIQERTQLKEKERELE
jgi:hypothetical protein